MTALLGEGTDLAEIREHLDAKVGQAFAAATRRKARDVHSLSLSALGACTRQGAYKLAGVAPSDPPSGEEEERQALLGTWMHRGLLPRMRALLRRSRSEMKVTLAAAGIHLPGQLDLYDARGQGVIDAKSVKEWGLGWIRQHGPRPGHRAQVRGYALACIQQGKPVRWVAYIYVDRATGEHETIVEPFTAGDAMGVLDRVEELVRASRNVAMAPRDEKGPGLSVVCDGCPWLRDCWGSGASPGDVGAQAGLARRGAEIDTDAASSAAALYAAGRARATAAKADQTFARAILDGLPAGRYGRWLLGWSSRSEPKPDAKAMAARLVALGEPIPMTGGGTRTISVDPAPLGGEEPVFAKGTG